MYINTCKLVAVVEDGKVQWGYTISETEYLLGSHFFIYLNYEHVRSVGWKQKLKTPFYFVVGNDLIGRLKKKLSLIRNCK